MEKSPKELRPKTRREIAEELKISVSTLRRRLTAAEVDLPSGLVYPADQRSIYEALYYPPHLKPEWYNPPKN